MDTPNDATGPKTTPLDGALARIAASKKLYTEWTDDTGAPRRVRTMKIEPIDKKTLRITDTKGRTYDLPKNRTTFRRG